MVRVYWSSSPKKDPSESLSVESSFLIREVVRREFCQEERAESQEVERN